MRQSEIDVLIPFHRLDGLLTEAIESVLRSTGVSLKLRLLDNRRDRTHEFSIQPFEEILKDTSHTIEVVGVDEPHTYSHALNTGIEKSKATFIALMNSDDLVEPTRFLLQISALKKENSDLSICKLKKFSGNREILSLIGQPNLEMYSFTYLLIGAYGADASAMFRRSWIEMKRRTFPETQHSDWLFALQNYSEAKISSIDTPLYLYRMHRNQFTRTAQSGILEEEIVFSLKKHFKEMGIPIKFKHTLQAISTPSLRVKLNPVEMRELVEVCGSYLESFALREQKKDIRRILSRRILITIRNPLLLPHLPLRWWIPVAYELVRIIRDLLTGKIKLSSTRLK
jgi:hypothetical protein